MIPQEIINTIASRTEEIRSNMSLMNIKDRAFRKFHDESGKRVVASELLDYLIYQLKSKKQNIYYSLLPLLMICCESIGETFEDYWIIDNPKNYRDAVYCLI